MLPRQLLQKIFHLLYTDLAWSYDLVAWLVSAGYWYRWVETALPLIEEGPVIEVGCGRGHLLEPIARRGHEVVGVDRTMQMARYAARRSGQPVLRGDGRQLPFPDGHFGTLITTFPAPYVLQAESQREFARVVRPGGQWLWVDAPGLEPTPGTTLARLLTLLARGTVPEGEMDERLARDLTGDQWQVELRRYQVGPTSIGVRVARRQG